MLPAQAKNENRRRTLLRKVFEKIQESKWGTSYKSIWIKQSWTTSHIPYNMIADVHKPELLKVKIHTNINKLPQSYGRYGAFGKEYLLYECLLSQSVICSILSSFKCSSIMVCLKKMLNGEMSFKKDTEKIVLLKVKDLIHIVKFRNKKICIFLSSVTSHPLEW